MTEEQIKSYYTSPEGEKDVDDSEDEEAAVDDTAVASEDVETPSESKEEDSVDDQPVEALEPSEEIPEVPSCDKCACEDELEHIVLSAKFTRGDGDMTEKDKSTEPETPSVLPPKGVLPEKISEESLDWMKDTMKLGEEVRKRGPAQIPFVPIYVPVVVPVVRAKESEEKVNKRSVCPQVFASLVSLATVLLYYFIILWRH